jgi:hypothetical protein
MKIESSSLLLGSQHASFEKHTVTETLRMWTGDRRPDFEGRQSAPAANRTAGEVVTLSTQARSALEAEESKEPEKSEGADPDRAAEADPRSQLIKLMVEALTGRKIRIIRLEDAKPDAPPEELKDPGQAAPQQAGYGIEYDYRETHYEAEQTIFAAAGVVRTADGREIRFSLSLAMSREYFREDTVSIRLGDAVKKDPLVINFSGTAARLTDTRFSFDIDADGTPDHIPFVGAGSGFLALDLNLDGKINDGGELFGTRTGDGFAELAAYDQDRNGWIDENDAVFKNLRVWTKDAEGNDTLYTLAEKNIGAISLAHVETPFAIKDGGNVLNGQVRATGTYVSENGTAGTVQQIDLAV